MVHARMKVYMYMFSTKYSHLMVKRNVSYPHNYTDCSHFIVKILMSIVDLSISVAYRHANNKHDKFDSDHNHNKDYNSNSSSSSSS